MDTKQWWKPLVAEFVGTFTLVFIGVGAIVATGGANLVAIALAHGLAIAVMVTALGHVSGGHFNPAVTVAAVFTKKMRADFGLAYIVFQLLGGFFGAVMLVAALPSGLWMAVDLGTPHLASVTPAQAIIVEAVLTFFLVFVIFGVAMDARNHMRAMGGLAIGLTVAMDIFMGGPLTGAAMNPARAFGPALVAGSWDNHLIYWVAPIFGAILAGLVYDTTYLAKKKPETPEVPSEEPKEETPAPETEPKADGEPNA